MNQKSTAASTVPTRRAPMGSSTAEDAVTSHGQATKAAALSAEATTRTLTVRVIWHEDHKPVPQTSLTLTLLPSDRKDAMRLPEIKAQTTSQGEALVKYPAPWSRARLEVTHTKGAMQRLTLSLPVDKPVVVELARGARLFGTVWLETKGEPVAGAEVRVFDADNSSPVRPPLRQALSDKDGGFSIGQLPAGSWRLIATHGAHSSALKDSELKPIPLATGEESGPHDLILRAGNTLTGIVRDQATKAPIAGAEIRSVNLNPVTNKEMNCFKEQTAISDAKGAYKLEGLPLEDLYIKASAENYVSALQTLHPGDGLNFHDFELEPGARVEVLAVDDQGRPVEGAKIIQFGSTMSADDPAQTNAEGKVVLKGISRTTPPSFWARKEGYKDSGDERAQFAPGEPQGKVKLLLKPLDNQGFFSGRVTASSGAPLGGIHVRAGSLTLKRRDQNEAITAADGTYRLAVKARDERYVLSASAQGRDLAPAWRGDLTPGTADKPTEANFSLGAGHQLRGTVVSTEGKPIAGVSVKACTPERFFIYDGMPLDEREQKTDEAGAFKFRDLPAGEVELILEARGWVDIYRKRVPVDQDAHIVMTPIGMIRGRIADESGESIPSFSVNISGVIQQETGYHSRYANKRSFTSADGRFTLEELDPRGDYEVSIEADGYAAELKKGVRAASADQAQEILFTLKKGDALKGRLVDAQSGAPLPGLPVLYGFYASGYFDWFWVEQLSGLQKTRTDGEGSFTFREGAQHGALMIRAPGYGRRVITAAERSQFMNGADLMIPLEPEATLSGVYSFGGQPVSNAPVSLLLLGGGNGQGMEFTRSDLQGKYRWESLTAGDYNLSIITERSNVTRRFRLKTGEQKQVDLIGDFGSLVLQGRVLDPKGAPRNGFLVNLKPSFPTSYVSFSCRTGTDGGYRIEGLAAGEYIVDVNPPGNGRTPPSSKSESIRIQGNADHDFTY